MTATSSFLYPAGLTLVAVQGAANAVAPDHQVAGYVIAAISAIVVAVVARISFKRKGTPEDDKVPASVLTILQENQAARQSEWNAHTADIEAQLADAKAENRDLRRQLKTRREEST